MVKPIVLIAFAMVVLVVFGIGAAIVWETVSIFRDRRRLRLALHKLDARRAEKSGPAEPGSGGGLGDRDLDG